MDITRAALRRIKQLKDRQGVARATGLRLGLEDGGVCLRWDPAGPLDEDLVMSKQGIPVFINALAYARLADYVLDFDRVGGSVGFRLRSSSGMKNGRLGRRTPKRNRRMMRNE